MARSEAGPRRDENLGVVEKPIETGTSQEWVAKEIGPLGRRAAAARAERRSVDRWNC
jgi:hypothetical protein